MKLSINLMLLEPEKPPAEDKWMSNFQESCANIVSRMCATGEVVHHRNALLYSNKENRFAVEDMDWYVAKRQVADKPPELSQKWTGL